MTAISVIAHQLIYLAMSCHVQFIHIIQKCVFDITISYNGVTYTFGSPNLRNSTVCSTHCFGKKLTKAKEAADVSMPLTHREWTDDIRERTRWSFSFRHGSRLDDAFCGQCIALLYLPMLIGSYLPKNGDSISKPSANSIENGIIKLPLHPYQDTKTLYLAIIEQ